jgi:hypothetical protein
VSLEIERRSSGSNEKKQPAVPSIVSPPGLHPHRAVHD